MPLQQTLIKARTCVQRGQVDAAVKLYRGLLVSLAQHPQINLELGVLLLERHSPQQAIPYLSKAVAALPAAFEPCVCLMVAHQRCGDLVRAREVLAQMHAQSEGRYLTRQATSSPRKVVLVRASAATFGFAT